MILTEPSTRLGFSATGFFRALELLRSRWNQSRALGFCFDAFSSREPVPTSLENALTGQGSHPNAGTGTGPSPFTLWFGGPSPRPQDGVIFRMVDHFVSLKDLTPEERRLREVQRRADAELAIKEHEEAQRAFYENRDRLRALRLAREAKQQK